MLKQTNQKLNLYVKFLVLTSIAIPIALSTGCHTKEKLLKMYSLPTIKFKKVELLGQPGGKPGSFVPPKNAVQGDDTSFQFKLYMENIEEYIDRYTEDMFKPPSFVLKVAVVKGVAGKALGTTSITTTKQVLLWKEKVTKVTTLGSNIQVQILGYPEVITINEKTGHADKVLQIPEADAKALLTGQKPFTYIIKGKQVRSHHLSAKIMLPGIDTEDHLQEFLQIGKDSVFVDHS